MQGNTSTSCSFTNQVSRVLFVDYLMNKVK